MRLNTIFKLTSLLGLASFVNCKDMSFYGNTVVDRPSPKAIPACGGIAEGVDFETDYFIALNHVEYDASRTNPANANSATVCGKCIKVMLNNKWVVGKVVDRCPRWSTGGLDVSPTIFTYLTNEDDGISSSIEWEFTSCSNLGKKGTGSGGSSSDDTSNKPKSKDNKHEQKTSSTKTHTTTTITKKSSSANPTSTTQVVKPTDVTKPVQKEEDQKPVIQKPVIQKPEDAQNQNPQLPPKEEKEDQNQPSQTPPKEDAVTPSNSKPDHGNASKTEANKPVEVNHATDAKEGGNSIVGPTVGILGVSAAAGIALVYAKRTNRLDDIKEKFPEAFSNIKRSISRRSTQIRRSLSHSGRAISRGSSKLRRSLSKKHSSKNEDLTFQRSKRDYRNSLNAHYPLSNGQKYNNPEHQIYFNENYYDDDNNDEFNNGRDDTNYEENPYVYQFNAYDQFENAQNDSVDTTRQ